MRRRAIAPTVACALLALAASASALQVPAGYKASVALSDWENGTATFFGGPQVSCWRVGLARGGGEERDERELHQRLRPGPCAHTVRAQDGLDTLYNATLPAGSCGYGPVDMRLWPFHGVVGVAPGSLLATARPQHGCGTCVAVKCIDPTPKACRMPFQSGGSSDQGGPVLTVLVVDTCPSCAANTLNLHAFGFEEIARTRFGSVQIAYKQVPCEPPEGVYVRVDAWDKSGWLRLSVTNVEGDGGITSVSIRASSTPPPPTTSHTTGPAPTVTSTSSATTTSIPAATATGSSARTHGVSTIAAPITTAPTTTTAAPADVASGAASAGLPGGGDGLEGASGDDPMRLLVTRQGPVSDQADDGKGWVAMNNTFGAAWEVGTLPAPAPYGWDIKVVDVTGAKVIVRNAVPAGSTAQQLLHTFTFPDQLLPNNKTTLSQLLLTGQGPSSSPTSSSSSSPSTTTTTGTSRRHLLANATATSTPTASPSVDAGVPPSVPPPAGPASPPPAPTTQLVRAPLIIPEDIPVVQGPNGTQVQGSAKSAAPTHLGTNVIVNVPRQGQGTWLPGMDVGMARPPTMPSPPPPPSASAGMPPSPGSDDDDCECKKKKRHQHHPPSPPCPQQ